MKPSAKEGEGDILIVKARHTKFAIKIFEPTSVVTIYVTDGNIIVPSSLVISSPFLHKTIFFSTILKADMMKFSGKKLSKLKT